MKEETGKRVAGSIVSLMHCGRAMLLHCVGLFLQVRLRIYHIVAAEPSASHEAVSIAHGFKKGTSVLWTETLSCRLRESEISSESEVLFCSK